MLWLWLLLQADRSLPLILQTKCPLLHDQDLSLPGSSVHGILQARKLEWVPIPFPRGSSQSRDRTWVSCIAGTFFIVWATREASRPG